MSRLEPLVWIALIAVVSALAIGSRVETPTCGGGAVEELIPKCRPND
jgi:hypothetical protein